MSTFIPNQCQRLRKQVPSNYQRILDRNTGRTDKERTRKRSLLLVFRKQPLKPDAITITDTDNRKNPMTEETEGQNLCTPFFFGCLSDRVTRSPVFQGSTVRKERSWKTQKKTHKYIYHRCPKST